MAGLVCFFTPAAAVPSCNNNLNQSAVFLTLQNQRHGGSSEPSEPSAGPQGVLVLSAKR